MHSGELKKLGGPVGVVTIPAEPVTDPQKSALIETVMRKGLIAENQKFGCAVANCEVSGWWLFAHR